jgi:DNA-binding GntR family transcriptional regulator
MGQVVERVLTRENLLPQEEETEFFNPSPRGAGLRVEAMERILALITSGELQPDDKQSEQDLVNRWPEMSRTPIREALAVLAAEGFVRQRPQVGFFIVPVLWPDVEEILSLRTQIEALVVQRLAEIGLGHASDSLEAIQKRLDAARKHEAVLEFAQIDTEFHSRMAHAAGFRTAMRSISSWRNKLLAFRRGTLMDPPGMNDVFNEHSAVLGAIKKGDAVAAVNSLAAHMAGTKGRLAHISVARRSGSSRSSA